MKRKKQRGTSLVVQWLTLRVSTAGGVGDSIPGQGTKILLAMGCGQKKKKKRKEKVRLGWQGEVQF